MNTQEPLKWIPLSERMPTVADFTYDVDVYIKHPDYTWWHRIESWTTYTNDFHNPKADYWISIPKQQPPPLPTKSEQAKTDAHPEKSEAYRCYKDCIKQMVNTRDTLDVIAIVLQWAAAQTQPNYDQILNAVAIVYSNRDFINAKSGPASTALALLWQEFKQLKSIPQLAQLTGVREIVGKIRATSTFTHQGIFVFPVDVVEPLIQQLEQLEPKEKGGVLKAVESMADEEADALLTHFPATTKPIEKMMEKLLSDGGDIGINAKHAYFVQRNGQCWYGSTISEALDAYEKGQQPK